MLFFCACFSQNDTVYWYGKVSDKSSALPVKQAIIRLKLSNGGMYETRSNDSGYYSFALKTVFENGELSAGTDIQTDQVSRKTNGFLPSAKALVFGFPQSRHIVHHFLLEPAPGCLLNKLPQLWFGVNSTRPVPYKDTEPDLEMMPDEVLMFYYELLLNQPAIVVELRGTCDPSEKNKTTLSEKRATLVAQKLISKGIPAARLVIAGLGTSVHPVTDRDLNTPHTQREKEARYQKNRSVSIRIIHWDYTAPAIDTSEKAPSIH